MKINGFVKVPAPDFRDEKSGFIMHVRLSRGFSPARGINVRQILLPFAKAQKTCVA